MKKVIVIAGLVLLAVSGYSQSQIKLYIQQIAANKVYIEYLQKGYSIAKKGLTTIGNIKNGHWSLDKDFFAGLENINPKVRHYAKVADIVALNIQIVKRYKQALKEARASDRFTGSELDYFGKVFTGLIDNCAVLVDELTLLLKASELKMSDDERIKRIDKLYTNMQDNYVFVQDFSGSMEIMTLQRDKEVNDAAVVKGLYGF